MKIKVMIGQPNSKAQDLQNAGEVDYTSKQKVSFLYLITKAKNSKIPEPTPPQKQYYTTTDGVPGLTSIYPDNGLILMNYNDGARIDTDIANYRQYGIMTVPRDDYVNAVSIYKKEIWYEQDGYKIDEEGNFILDQNNKKIPNIVAKEENGYHLVTNQSDNGTIRDFNIANDRYYKYLYRFVYAGTGDNDLSLTEGLKEIIIPVKAKWYGWSLTELHEQEDENGKLFYTASLRDVWKFKNNVQPGDTTQQTSKTAQETLAKFPRFIHGPKDTSSGNVSCLLGRDVLPYDLQTTSYQYKKDGDNWVWDSVVDGNRYNSGGYKEELWPNVYYADATSNKAVDMLNHWKNFCYSGNPKLLKDNKGQKFIVQVHDTSNRVEDSWSGRPITISFSWTQIASADDVVIMEEED